MKSPRQANSTEATPGVSAGAQSPATVSGPGLVWVLAAVLAVQIVLLIVAGRHNRHLLNTDAIAYLRIASYYASGQIDLMVSGYWGPLLSWLIAPLLKLGLAPLDAGRVAMGGTAVVFLLGSAALFRAVRLPASGQVIGTCVVAVASIYWSVEYISPDLLMSGLISLAVARMIVPDYANNRRSQLTAGAWWGLAYLAKPVAFPLALVVSALLVALHLVVRSADRKQCLRALGLTLLAFAVVAGPWVLTLTVKYHRSTFSTSGRINHAIVGPQAADRSPSQGLHPFTSSFHKPDPGRLTVWEDPTNMKYEFWSPFESRTCFEHQIKLVKENFQTVVSLLADFDSYALGVIALFACLVIVRPWRETLARDRWRWLLVPVVCVAGVYLPVYVRAADGRYFYFAYPALLTIGLGAIAWLTARLRQKGRLVRLVAMGLLALSFGFWPLVRMLISLDGLRNDASASALNLAGKLRAANVRGPIAGSGMVMYQRAGLYTAFLLDQPWYGDERQPTPGSFKKSGARLIVVNRGDTVAAELEQDSDFVNLDQRLFASGNEAAQFPLQVFELRQP